MSTENGFCKEKKEIFEDSDATSKETDSSLGRKLEELIECPVCKNVMYPPIQQCSSGHPLCSSCKSLVKRCPTCRQALGKIRCLVLEQMAESVDLPCGYEMFGCNAKFPYPSGLNHEKNCKHRPLKLFNCPYAVQGDACSFTDNIPSLVTHLTSDHNVVIYENCAFIGTYIGLDSQRPPISVWKIIVIRSFGRLFCLHFQFFEYRNEPVYIAFVQLIGDENEAKLFSCSLQGGRYGRKMSWQGVPRSTKDSHSEIRSSLDGLVIPKQLIYYVSGGYSVELELVLKMA